MPDLLATVREALDEATPGPWRVEAIGKPPYDVIGVDPVCRPHDADDAAEVSAGLDDLTLLDARLIAHAPEWLAELVNEVERLRRSNENLRHISNANGDWNLKFMQKNHELDTLRARLQAADAVCEAASALACDYCDANVEHLDAALTRREATR